MLLESVRPLAFPTSPFNGTRGFFFGWAGEVVAKGVEHLEKNSVSENLWASVKAYGNGPGELGAGKPDPLRAPQQPQLCQDASREAEWLSQPFCKLFCWIWYALLNSSPSDLLTNTIVNACDATSTTLLSTWHCEGPRAAPCCHSSPVTSMFALGHIENLSHPTLRAH